MLSATEKKIFEEAFYLGFMVAFDGWNGETFDLSQRKPNDSEILVAKMQELRGKYELEQKEKAKLFPAPVSNDDFVCTGV